MTPTLTRLQAALIDYDEAQLRLAAVEVEYEGARGMHALIKAALDSARADLNSELRPKRY